MPVPSTRGLATIDRRASRALASESCDDTTRADDADAPRKGARDVGVDPGRDRGDERGGRGEERVNLACAHANESAINHVGRVFVLSWLVLLEAFPLGASEECGLTS